MDVDIDHPNTATDTERWLPNELWLTIFHHLIQPNDLCHIIQTSRKFYTLALPLLLVRLQWRNTTGALRNLAFWDGQAREACLIPRELVVGIVGVGSAGYFNGGSVGGHGGGGGDGGGGGIGGGGGGGGTVTTTALTLANVGAGGRLPPVPGSTAWSSIVESQETIYTQILQRIPKFTSLQTLTLTDARLPLYFYGLLQSLPALTNLGIYRCSLRLIPWDTPIIQSAWTMKLGSMCLEDIQVTEDTTSLVGGGGGNVNPFHGLVAINAQNQGHPALVNAILANAGVNNVVGANTGNNINPGGGGVGPAGALGGGAGGGGGNDGGAPPPPQPPPAPLHPLKLLHSFLQLEDLTLSWRGDIAVSYLRSVWKLPQNLRTLTVHIKSLSQFNLSSVVALLRGCAGSVRRVRMRVGHVSKCLEVPEVRLPWLVEFSGPAVMAPAILVHGTGAGVPQDSGNPTPLPIAIGTVAAADDTNMDTDEEDSAAAAAAERLATGLKVLEIHGPVPLQAFLDMIEKPAAREVEKLTVLVQQWDAEALHAVSQLLPNLKSLTMVYAAGGPSDEFLVSIGPELLKRLSSLQTLVLLSECPEGGGGQATSSASASHQMQGGLRAHAHTHASIHNGRGGHHNPNQGHGQGQIANLAHGRTHHNRHPSSASTPGALPPGIGTQNPLDKDKPFVPTPEYVRDLLASWQIFSSELRCVSLARRSVWEKVPMMKVDEGSGSGMRTRMRGSSSGLMSSRHFSSGSGSGLGSTSSSSSSFMAMDEEMVARGVYLGGGGSSGSGSVLGGGGMLLGALPVRMQRARKEVIKWAHYTGGDDGVAGLRVQAISVDHFE